MRKLTFLKAEREDFRRILYFFSSAFCSRFGYKRKESEILFSNLCEEKKN